MIEPTLSWPRIHAMSKRRQKVAIRRAIRRLCWQFVGMRYDDATYELLKTTLSEWLSGATMLSSIRIPINVVFRPI